jgi:hypothetical protein
MMPESAWVTELTGNILRMMAESPAYDLVIGNVSIGAPFGRDQMIGWVSGYADEVMEVAKKGSKPLAVVMDTADLRIEDFEQ